MQDMGHEELQLRKLQALAPFACSAAAVAAEEAAETSHLGTIHPVQLTFAIRLARYESHFVHLVGGDPVQRNLLRVLARALVNPLDAETNVMVKGAEVPPKLK